MHENLYLLEDSEEARELGEKLCNLLESSEPDSIELAYQIMQGGGVPKMVFTPLAVMSIFHKNETIKTQAHHFLQNHAHHSLLAHLKGQIWNLNHLYEYYEQDMAVFLRRVTQYPDLRRDAFANFALRLTKKGALFCLQNQTASEHHILACMLGTDDSLSLDYFGLASLPVAIGDFEQIKWLSLRDNPLQDVPESLANLRFLETLRFTKERVHERVISKFERFFPKLMAEEYYEEAGKFFFANDLAQTYQSMEKATHLQPKNADYWSGLGWIQQKMKNFADALFSLRQAVIFAPNEADALKYQTFQIPTLERISAHSQAREQAKTVLTLLERIPPNAWETDFFVCKGLALTALEQYEEAKKNYEEALEYDSRIGNGAGWYNLACLHAKQGNKTEMLTCLHKALEIGDIFWRDDVLQDIDFEPFWEDAEGIFFGEMMYCKILILSRFGKMPICWSYWKDTKISLQFLAP